MSYNYLLLLLQCLSYSITAFNDASVVYRFSFWQVITSTRRYQSEAGRFVPAFLPDLSTQWSKNHGDFESVKISAAYKDDFDKEFREENNMGQDDVESSESESENDEVLSADTNDDDDDTNEDQDDEWTILGLRAFKVRNEDEIVNNILVGPPAESIKVAEFDSTTRARLCYNYAAAVQSNDARSAEDKEEVRDWETRAMPPNPGHREGFAEGAAKNWFYHLNGENHDQVLPRVLKKLTDPRLKRPSIADYSARDSLLETDQKVIDSLPEEQFYTSIGFAKNAGK